MKAVQGPYPRFGNYYPLEEVIDLYMEIWYDSDSDSDDEWSAKIREALKQKHLKGELPSRTTMDANIDPAEEALEVQRMMN